MKLLYLPDYQWIPDSNWIEGVRDPKADQEAALAYRWLLQQAHLTDAVILETHRRIMKRLHPRIAGRFRRRSVWVGARACPPWEEIQPLMQTWLMQYADLNEAKPSSPELEQRIIQAHVEFEKIHPFVDCNGRTGRHLMNWHRAKLGLAPFWIKFSERGGYYDWFHEDDAGIPLPIT